MWNFNSDNGIWSKTNDGLKMSDFDLYERDLNEYRLYSKCLSGSTFVPFSDSNNLFDILGEYEERNWYIGPNGSPYTYTTIPPQNPVEINNDTRKDYYEKFNSEYGLSLKNHFTPSKAIEYSLDNINYVDVATTEKILDIDSPLVSDYIDGVRLKNGHRVLVKDQKTREALPVSVNPDEYFNTSYTIIQNFGSTIEYEYLNEENGIYVYQDGQLSRDTDLNEYENCIRYSAVVKLGSQKDKQYHLKRLNSGYFPDVNLNEPIEFIENENWVVRNRVNYNNLFETNYNDIISKSEHSYIFNNRTYIIPERIISVGEYGVIVNFQEGKLNIIDNKYKDTLNSISETQKYYWIAGDNETLLKVRKHDFYIERVVFNASNENTKKQNLKSTHFINDNVGAVVGDLNTIHITENGGRSWVKIEIEDLESKYYDKVLFLNPTKMFVVGKNGVFLEIYKRLNKWEVYKRRISKYENKDDEYILVQNINDVIIHKTSSWNVSHNYSNYEIMESKELLLFVTDENKIIIKDLNNSLSDEFEFFYLDYPQSYSDIKNITNIPNTNDFLITGMDNNDDVGVFLFSLDDFNTIGKNDPYSNILVSEVNFNPISSEYPNQLIFNNTDIVLCGNNSLLKNGDYSDLNNIILSDLDPSFQDNLKSRLLILDYDLASKLNFFTKEGDYILPESTEINLSLDDDSYLKFEPIVYAPAEPSNMTQSEINWIQYWKESTMSFEYKTSDPMTESSKVLFSDEFNYYTGQSTEVTNNITVSLDDIIDLAPDITMEGFSRFRAHNTISAPTNLFKIYAYNYLLIYRVSSSYQVKKGDVFKIKNNSFEGNFIANKIVTFGLNKYIYFFTEFPESLISDLPSQSLEITNLNTYNSKLDFIDKFNKHILSKAYVAELSEDNIIISGKYAYETAYYNLATSIKTELDDYFLSYKDSFLKFGYTPTYNLLDYLEYLNDENNSNYKFFANKEFLTMPIYKKIPTNGINSADDNNIYIDHNNETNKISLGKNLEFEWNSLLLNTFIDVYLYQDDISYNNATQYKTEKVLIANKYERDGRYYIEFNKKLNFDLGEYIYYIDLSSRRKLVEISSDLNELNNIQRSKKLKQYTGGDPTHEPSYLWAAEYYVYDKELNYKFNTDSYCKVLLSDSDVVKNISGVLYTDSSNVLSLNITNLENKKEIRILNTANFGGKLFISCQEKHGLKDGEGAVFTFDGGEGSSEFLNLEYFGYHVINFVNEYSFYLNLDYNITPSVGNDTGYLYFTKKDPLMDFRPIDLIEVGADKKGKQNIELTDDNIELNGSFYVLNNVDYNKYRFRLVDGLDVIYLASNYNWVYEAEVSGAVIGLNENGIVWYKGKWDCGRWFGGTWISGEWVSGDWYGGLWCSKKITDNYNNVKVDVKSSNEDYSVWYGGRWYGGIWENGTWVNGRWYDGVWETGHWYNGTWNFGTWLSGMFTGGIWVDGVWERGKFNCDNGPAYWVNGRWNGGDFENGLWFSGIFEEKNTEARFGIKSHNSRTSIWKGGKFISGSFHSQLNLDSKNNYTRARVHKYSIWYSGEWYSGNWYGGVAYNINFKSGTWHGGILEDIQIIGCGQEEDTLDNFFVLNGIFRFNIGDKVKVIDNILNNTYSVLGSNDTPVDYTVLFSLENSLLNQTKIYVDKEISLIANAPQDLGIRLVSHFESCNWKSGIWTNGIYDNGLWEGGIWYNGVFNATWT